MLVIFMLLENKEHMYIAAAAVIAAHVLVWWFIYRKILIDEAAFFEGVTEDMYAIHFRLRTFETAVRQIRDGVIIVSEEEDLVYMNETVRNLFAVYEGEVDISRYDEFAAGFSEKLERAKIIEAANENRPPETINFKGQYYKTSYIALVPEKGRWRGAVAVISDVTESIKADRMQSEFISNVSHELRTPLTNVKTYAETLMTGAVEDEATVHEFLETIVTETDEINRLIQDFRKLASMDYQELVLNIDECNIPPLVRMLVKKLSLSANKRAITINCMFPEDLNLSLEIDRARIEQVITNILNNSIKYTDEKGRIDVEIISAQNCVQIVIRDNGMGIPEEDLSRVFERLFRSEKAKTGGTSGTGLGLGISKQIVEAHGGTIEIESVYGRGTTVTITLPRNKGRGVPGIL